MLLNDKQITLLAMKGMIEPFTAGQVRTVTKNGQEERVISYGLSSAGYDIRLGRSFKVFKPVWEGLALVDPKMTQGSLFNEFEDVDYCIIPPNSYVLGYSVERFRVPRDVQVLVVGKSTYARCFRGDTRVALVDGTSPTLEEMAHRAESGESFWGYSVNEEGRIAVAQLESPRYVGRDSLVEVLLDNEKSIFCTPDHLFMLRNGSWMQADQLRPNTSLMPLYRTTGRGYEMVYQLENGRLYPTHRLSDEWNIRNGAYVAQEDTHRHHVDLNKRNNNPWNIVRMGAAEHTRMHNSINYGDGFDAIRHGAAVRRAIQQLSQDPVWAANFSRIQSERAAKFWNEEQYLETRAKLINQRCNPSDATRQAHRDATLHRFEDANERVRLSEAQRAAWANSNIERRVRQAEIARGINIRQEITADVVHDALTQTGSIRGAARMLNCDRAVFRRFPETMQAFREQVAIRNHKVLSVRQIQGSHDVFCLAVPEAGNFALESGVFVHNCGLIVNVTPGEPGWEGHWTIEISNASPLPAIVYADEGIAQCLFFRIDEPEVSYADRSGKYQGQGAEVVTARV